MPLVSAAAAGRTRYDLCVVGAGAAGLALGLRARKRGMSVIIVEQGGLHPGSVPSEAEIVAEVPHDSGSMTNCQALGGTLHLWGGRCMPLDPEDFRPRGSDREPGWPIPYEEYARWIAPAAAFLGVEPAFSRPAPAGWPPLEGIRLDRTERLNSGHHLADLRRRALRSAEAPDILLATTVDGLLWSRNDTRVRGVSTAAAGAGAGRVAAGVVVLACGGLETARLLLIEQRRAADRFGGAGGPLGRYYMGHLTGSIAEIGFAEAGAAAEFAYGRTGGETPARRRFLRVPGDPTSVAFWVEGLPGSDPRHGSGEFSIKHLASGARGARRRHLTNVWRDPAGAAAGIVSVIHTRLTPRERHPSRLSGAGKGPYRLAYHGEHLPSPDSRVTLSQDVDSRGRPKLRIAFAYDEATIRGTVTAHRALARALQASGLARLDLPADDAAMARAVRAQARDGYHQFGLTRMAKAPGRGVVDSDCRVHGTGNLFVASASVFPVGGQANPTLSVVAMALRLAERLTQSRHNLPSAEGAEA